MRTVSISGIHQCDALTISTVVIPSTMGWAQATLSESTPSSFGITEMDNEDSSHRITPPAWLNGQGTNKLWKGPIQNDRGVSKQEKEEDTKYERMSRNTTGLSSNEIVTMKCA